MAQAQQNKQLPAQDDAEIGRGTLKPVVFANGGAKEAEKKLPAASMLSPKRTKHGGVGRKVGARIAGGDDAETKEIAVQ